ncbi:hypothetical protein AX14_012065 [Amanita brunnescens Koide BX004]|nr:hypothetical protein AX14_012065 [Amanita brunnescens Koide BX004]
MPAIVKTLLVKRAPSIAPTMGAIYVGAMLTGILYGSTNVQTFLYYKSYPQDAMFQKWAVALLWILDTLHMVFTIIEFWHYLIESFGNYEALLQLHWSFSLQIALSVIVILVVQSFYTRRVWKLSSDRYQRIWAWLLIIVLLVVYAAGITFIVELYSASTLIQMSHLRWSIILGLSSSTLDDFMIATAICHLLSLRRTSFAETKSKIWTIMFYAVISGALTSICSLTSVIALAVMPHNLVFQGIEFLLPKLYINSYLAMLNARKSLKDHAVSINPPSKMIQFNDFETRHLTSHDFHGRSTVDEPNVPSSSRAVKVKVDAVR